MTEPDINRRTLVAAVAATGVPTLAGCLGGSGGSFDESDFQEVDQDISYSDASECADMRVRLQYVGDGDIDGEVEFDTRLLAGGGDPVSDWHRSTADFSANAPADEAWATQGWCKDRDDDVQNIEDATDVEWRLRE